MMKRLLSKSLAHLVRAAKLKVDSHSISDLFPSCRLQEIRVLKCRQTLWNKLARMSVCVFVQVS